MAGGSLGTIRGTIQIDYDSAGIARATTDTENFTKKGAAAGITWNKVGTTLLVAGGVIAGGFALAVNSAADFEAKLSDIRAVTGATTADMEKVRQKALQLGKDTQFSASEAADAMTELAKAGISIPDIMNGAADATVNLAAAGGVALPEAATIASNAMNQFNLNAQDMPKIADLIAGAANSSAIDVHDFGQSIAQAGAVSHLAGLSFADTAAAIALMGNAGIKGSDAGTSLKTFLQNLIPTTKEQIGLFQQLGIITKDGSNQFFDAAGHVKSLADVSQVLQNALKGQTKEQQLATLQTLFGSDAIRAAAILADNGAAGFNKMADAMSKVSAADVAKTKMDNLKGSIEQMKGSLETAAVQIGSALLPQLRQLVNSITGLVNWFSNLSSGTKSIIIDVVAAAGAFLLFGGAVIKTVQFFQGLSAAITLIKSLTLWSNIAKVATAAWTAAQWLLNLAMDANPVGLIILAIAALVAIIALLWTHSAAFRNFFIGLWNDIWGFLKTVGAWFAGPFANFFVGVWHAILSGINTIKGPFVAVFNFMVSVITAVLTVIRAVVGFFAPIFQAAFGLIVSIVKLAWDIISAIIAVAIAIIKPIITAFITGITVLWNAFWTGLKIVVQAVWNFISPFIQTAIFVIQAIISAAMTFIMGVWNVAWGIIKAVVTAVWAFIGPYVLTAIEVIKAVIQAAMTFISGVWDVAWGAIKAVVNAAWTFITGVVRTAVQVVVGIIDGIKAIVDKIRGFFNQLKDAASGGVGNLISFVGGIPGKIIGALGDLAGMLFDAGSRIIQGLIDGIKSMVGKVKDAVSNVLKGARDLLPFSPAKEGPFSGRGWTLFSGRSMVDSLAVGILDSANKVRDSMQVVMNNAFAVTAANRPTITTQFVGTGTSTPTVVIPAGQNVNIGDVNVNVPAPVVDPDQIGRLTARRIVNTLATASA